MNKLFVPYNIALKLKELGFYDECLGFYVWESWNNSARFEIGNDSEYTCETILAPLYQQIFDWFRDNYQYSCEITWTNTYKQYTGYLYPLSIEKNGSKVELCGNFDKDQYHEARIACLEKLIELINE